MHNHTMNNPNKEQEMNIGYVITVEQWSWSDELYAAYEKYRDSAFRSGLFDVMAENPAGSPYDMYTFIVSREYVQIFYDSLIALGVPAPDIRKYPIGQELK